MARKKNPTGTLVLEGSFMEWPFEVYQRPDGAFDGWVEGNKLAASSMPTTEGALDMIQRSIRAYHREGDIPAHKYTTWERIWGRKKPELSYEQIRQIQREEGLYNPRKSKKRGKKSSKKRKNPSMRQIMRDAMK